MIPCTTANTPSSIKSIIEANKARQDAINAEKHEMNAKLDEMKADIDKLKRDVGMLEEFNRIQYGHGVNATQPMASSFSLLTPPGTP